MITYLSDPYIYTVIHTYIQLYVILAEIHQVIIVVLYTGYILAILCVTPRHKVQAHTWTRAHSHCEGTFY